MQQPSPSFADRVSAATPLRKWTRPHTGSLRRRKRSLVLALTAATSAGLGGCVTADQDFLTEANSVAPYAAISFRDEHSIDATRLVRNGTAYVGTTPDGSLSTRLMAVDGAGWYVAQVKGAAVAGGEHAYYAVLRVDLANHRAYAFNSIGIGLDGVKGMHACGDPVCIDDLASYVASAEAFANAGRIPDAVYVISVE